MSTERPEHGGPVPAHPVALIEVDPAAGTVTLNGQPVVVAEGTDLHVAGVHAAATRVAQVLNRPVRALAKDPSGQTAMVVNPDGSVTDIQDTVPRTAASHPATAARPVPARSSSSRSARPAAAEPPAGPRVRPRGIGLVSIAASLAVVATVGTALLMGAGDADDPPQTAGSGESSEPTTATPTPAPPPYELTAGAVLERKAVVRVRAVGAVTRLRVTVTSSELPARVQLVLMRVGGHAAPVQRTARLSTRGQRLTVTDLAPGTYRWRVTVTGADPVTGRVRVTAPPASSPATPAEPETPYVPEPESGTGSPGGGGNGGGHGGGNGGGNGDGRPNGPVDPSTGVPGPTAPVPN